MVPTTREEWEAVAKMCNVRAVVMELPDGSQIWTTEDAMQLKEFTLPLDHKIIGRTLWALREQDGVTRQKMAKVLDVTVTKLTEMEEGGVWWTVPHIERYMAELGFGVQIQCWRMEK